ncbi:exosortase A [Thiohalorhabdus methylotrophus]|uniref:Exosortase A n=1 Tax=Thiohalorhabdus methylotrophus TaxID=3242694 RepID=A0ABV4TVG2_9GAMM
MTVQGHEELRLPDPVRGWTEARPLVLALLYLAGLVAVYHETALSMAAIWWRSQTYAHGVLVLPVSAYFLWRRRRLLASLPLGPDARGLVALGALTGTWFLAQRAEVLFMQHLALVAMIPAGLWALLGARFVRAAAFPLGFLIFAVPLGEGLVPLLRDFTATFSVSALQITGIPVYREGHYISIPEGRFLVADACSGIRYLIASLAIGTLFAYLNYRSLWRRLAFIAAAAAVPVLANGVRAYGIVVLAHLSDMRLATGVDHIIYGWVFFGVVMVLLFWLGGFWRDARSGVPEEPAQEEPGRIGRGASNAGLALVGALVLAVAGAGPAGAAWLNRSASGFSATTLDLPPGKAGWRGPAPVEGTWHPRYRGADRMVHRAYRGGEGTVRVLLIHYRNQQQGAELISSGNSLHNGKHWVRTGEGRETADLPGSTDGFGVRELLLKGPGGRRLVWQWYDIGGHVTSRPIAAKLWAAWEEIRSGRPDATLIAVATDYEGRLGPARKRLSRFLGAFPAMTRGGRLVRAMQGEGS